MRVALPMVMLVMTVIIRCMRVRCMPMIMCAARLTAVRMPMVTGVVVMMCMLGMLGMRRVAMVMFMSMFMSVLMIVLCMCLSIQRGMQGKVNNLQGQRIQCRQYAAWHPKRYRCVFNRLSWHAVTQERQRFVHDSGNHAVLIDVWCVGMGVPMVRVVVVRMIMVCMIVVMTMTMLVIMVVVVMCVGIG